MKALRNLAEADLRAIAAALRSGRLTSKFTSVGLQRCVPAQNPELVALEMQALVDEGLQIDHLALFLETLAEDRKNKAVMRDEVDLVWTGPEAPGVVSRDTGVVVRELFMTARDYVLVAGYAVHQGREVFRGLADRMSENLGLEVHMFLNVQRRHSDTSAESEILHRFAHEFRTKEWPGERMPELYHDPRALLSNPHERASLHAKCIVVDREVAFVSSANFTEAAQVRNIEVGVLVRSESFACKLADHFEGLVTEGLLRLVPGI